MKLQRVLSGSDVVELERSNRVGCGLGLFLSAIPQEGDLRLCYRRAGLIQHHSANGMAGADFGGIRTAFLCPKR